jgi:LysM repeat protein
MRSFKSRLLSGTYLPVVVGMGVALAAGGSPEGLAQSQNPCAANEPVACQAACSPCAAGTAAKGSPCAAGDRTYTIREGDSLASVAERTYGDAGLYRMLADHNGIADPDLVRVGQVVRLPANPCNPCATANPCAARSMADGSDCVVPRLQTAALQNPCAAAKPANPCNPCNPDAAANPCNPCAAAASPCGPCAAANPCNPCAANPCAAAANPCNPCNPCAAGEVVELTPAEAAAAYECIKGVMKAAYTGGLRQAAANPCNPCAAANPCNPCAAANPCNPCAANPCAAAANPCNPCAANPCAAAAPCNPCAAAKPANPCAASPCNPCAAASPCGPQALQAAAITDGAATVAQEYQGWERLNTMPYISATHGSRYVNNYPGAEAAGAYGRFEEVGDAMPVGGRIAKDSFTVSPDGRVGVGPLFIMEKMAGGFDQASRDWRYTMIMPDGSLFGMTGGQGSQNVQFCAECHALVADDQDSLFFMPEEYRVAAR